MLRGRASARAGSNRRGIHSHSWQSRKNIRVAMRSAALVRGEIGSPARRRGCAAPLDVVADGHPVHRGDPGGAGLPGPLAGLGDLGVFRGQPAPGLAMMRADCRRGPSGSACEVACQRSTQSAHARAGALEAGTRGCSRCAPADRSDPSDGDRPLERVEHPGDAGRVAGCSRSRGEASVVRSSSRGLRLSSRAWLDDAAQPVAVRSGSGNPTRRGSPRPG